MEEDAVSIMGPHQSYFDEYPSGTGKVIRLVVNYLNYESIIYQASHIVILTRNSKVMNLVKRLCFYLVAHI